MKIKIFRIVKIETPQEMQLDLAIASVSSKNIKVTYTRIFLDNPWINIAIKLSLQLDGDIDPKSYYRFESSIKLLLR